MGMVDNWVETHRAFTQKPTLCPVCNLRSRLTYCDLLVTQRSRFFDNFATIDPQWVLTLDSFYFQINIIFQNPEQPVKFTTILTTLQLQFKHLSEMKCYHMCLSISLWDRSLPPIANGFISFNIQTFLQNIILYIFSWLYHKVLQSFLSYAHTLQAQQTVNIQFSKSLPSKVYQQKQQPETLL